MDQYVLEARNISKSFNGVPVLSGVDFRLARGEVHAIVGQNGAGKSTLMKIINGVYSRDSGDILVEGKPCRPVPRWTLRGLASAWSTRTSASCRP